jgi:hypothetical protein
MMKSPSFWPAFAISVLLLVVDRVHSFSGAPIQVRNKSFGLSRSRPTGLQSSQTLHKTARIPTTLAQAQQDDANDASTLSTPLDRPVLALVDLASLLVFAGIGKASHAPDGSFDLLAVASVAFPFVVSWFLTSPLTGVYSADERSGNLLQDAFYKAGKGWIIAVPLGCVLRGIIKGYVPPLPFVVVTLIATLVLLGGARVLFAVGEDFFVELIN